MRTDKVPFIRLLVFSWMAVTTLTLEKINPHQYSSSSSRTSEIDFEGCVRGGTHLSLIHPESPK